MRARSGLPVCLVLALLAAPASAAGPARDPAAWLDKARSLHKAGRDVEARRAALTACALAPDDPAPLSELGSIDADLGRPARAINDYRASLALRPDYFVYVQLGEACVGLGRLDDARRAFEAAKAMDAKQADAYVREGYADLSAGRYARAERDVRALIAADPDNPLGYHHMASLLAFENPPRLPEAERYIREALAKFARNPASDPDDMLHAISWLGDILRDENKFGEAEASYENGLARCGPTNHDFRGKFLLALASLYENRDSTRALGYARRALDECPKPGTCKAFQRTQIFTRLALLCAKQGRRSAGLSFAGRAWAIFSSASPSAHQDGAQALSQVMSLATAYTALRAPGRARRACRLVLKTAMAGSPISAQARRCLAALPSG